MPEMLRLDLPNGRSIELKLRRSGRARSVWLRVSVRDGLVVTVPKGVSRREVMRIVTSKADWVTEHLTAVDAARLHAAAERSQARPEQIELRALGESWSLRYRETSAATVSARSRTHGELVVSGSITDRDACEAALRRWLMRYAKVAFGSWLDRLADETGLSYSGLSVKNQRSRWGSCTRACRISLSCKLLFLPPAQARYVLLHELCHTVEHNHSKRFWDLVGSFEPDLERLHAQMRSAWQLIPDWAHSA